MSNDTESLVITASGEDKIGLVEGFTRRISDSGCNIEESRMAALGGRFALLMRVSGNWDALAKLEARLPAVAEELGLHRNTVRNRLEAIEAVLPGKLDDPQTRVSAWIALQISP